MKKAARPPVTMHWEELTNHDWPRALARAKRTCLLPLGVLEKHGEHLPLGTDGLTVEALARATAQVEPALVFPRCYFSQIHEAKQWPGTIALSHRLLYDLLDELCAEIARNGVRKIVLINGHGGNNAMLDSFVRSRLEEPHDYSLYVARLSDYWSPPQDTEGWKSQMQSGFDYHGGEAETSVVMALMPELVKLSDLGPPAPARRRLAHLPPVNTAIGWYADFPEHYAGDAAAATAAKGEYLVERMVAHLAAIVKAVKADTAVPRLEREFFRRTRH